jgi:hypothetical protein
MRSWRKQARWRLAVPSLAEAQTQLRNAIVNEDPADVLPLLVGGRDPARRLAVHRRHYERSLVTALLEKFPAVVWLMGSSFVTEAARDFVHRRPPTAPCIAEYGGEFPEFMAERAGAERVPYLCCFARLEWCLEQIALAVDRPSLAMDALTAVETRVLPDVVLTLQPGLNYLEALWPIDDLMRLYLSETAPDQYRFEPADVRLELRGARGVFHINRLDAGAFVFRQKIMQGQSIGAAAEHALDADPNYEAGQALTMLIAGGLVTAVTLPARDAAR